MASKRTAQEAKLPTPENEPPTKRIKTCDFRTALLRKEIFARLPLWFTTRSEAYVQSLTRLMLDMTLAQCEDVVQFLAEVEEHDDFAIGLTTTGNASCVGMTFAESSLDQLVKSLSGMRDDLRRAIKEKREAKTKYCVLLIAKIGVAGPCTALLFADFAVEPTDILAHHKTEVEAILAENKDIFRCLSIVTGQGEAGPGACVKPDITWEEWKSLCTKDD